MLYFQLSGPEWASSSYSNLRSTILGFFFPFPRKFNGFLPVDPLPVFKLFLKVLKFISYLQLLLSSLFWNFTKFD